MKAVMVMFDTLSRRFLSSYGNDWVKTPNFDRLKNHTTQFDSFYSGSLPCMPARRELHTGRLNFLHRSWGPIEPFDFSAMEELKNAGIYTHIVTDHSHYWEDGGATYLPRYSSWEGFRGQEGDRWQAVVNPQRWNVPKQCATTKQGESFQFNWANRKIRKDENDYSSVQCMHAGLNFIDQNHNEDQWFLQIECFDPHEPFDVPQKYLDLYKDNYIGDYFDWPAYAKVVETSEQKEHIIKRYAALITMCDEYLGKILDQFDAYHLWEDTMLIVNTDHGFLMGEHDWWGKNIQPFYQEVAHLPFYFHDPKAPHPNTTTDALCQTIDIAPTLLKHFGLAIPEDVTGLNIPDVVSGKLKRTGALFGTFGAHVNITDGKFVYMRSPENPGNQPLYEYTLMPTRMRGFFKQEVESANLSDGFSFTKNMKLLQVPSKSFFSSYRYGNKLFDIEKDPQQLTAIDDINLESDMIQLLRNCMKIEDAPMEQYERLGIHDNLAPSDITKQRENRMESEKVVVDFVINESQQAKINMLKTFINGKMDVELQLNNMKEILPEASVDEWIDMFAKNLIKKMKLPKAHETMIMQLLNTADSVE